MNCGHNGKFEIPRFTGILCQECRYDYLTPFTKEEIFEDEHLKSQFGRYFENLVVTGS